MAITWANILEWETRPLDEIAQTLFEASQGLRDAYEKGQDHLNALQSEGEAVTAMRATGAVRSAATPTVHWPPLRHMNARSMLTEPFIQLTPTRKTKTYSAQKSRCRTW